MTTPIIDRLEGLTLLPQNLQREHVREDDVLENLRKREAELMENFEKRKLALREALRNRPIPLPAPITERPVPVPRQTAREIEWPPLPPVIREEMLERLRHPLVLPMPWQAIRALPPLPIRWYVEEVWEVPPRRTARRQAVPA